jgi:hypothetical protein
MACKVQKQQDCYTVKGVTKMVKPWKSKDMFVPKMQQRVADLMRDGQTVERGVGNP